MFHKVSPITVHHDLRLLTILGILFFKEGGKSSVFAGIGKNISEEELDIL